MLPTYFKEKGEIVLGSTDCPIGYCKVKVPKYLEGSTSELPLVEIMGRIGNSRNEGSADQVNKGDKVWVEFQKTEGVLRPLVVGSAYQAPDGLPNYPHDAFHGTNTLYKRHLIPRGEDGNVHEDFEEPKRYVIGRSIPIIVKEGISWIIQNGQSILTHLKTLSHFIFLESGTADLFSTKNLFLRARNNLYIWGNKIKFKGKTIEFDLDDLEMELKKFGIDAKQIILESGGVAKIIAGAIQLSASAGDLIISSQGKISQDANGSSLIKVAQNLINDPEKAIGWILDVAGTPLASLILTPLGLFEMKNYTAGVSLKWQVLDRKLDHLTSILGFIDEFLNYFIQHNHPCVVPTGPPLNASLVIALQVKVQLEIVNVMTTKANLALLMI